MGLGVCVVVVVGIWEVFFVVVVIIVVFVLVFIFIVFFFFIVGFLFREFGGVLVGVVIILFFVVFFLVFVFIVWFKVKEVKESGLFSKIFGCFGNVCLCLY